MAYTSWTVSAGETPTAAKWNILGANDASLRDGTGILDGAILLRHFGAGVWDPGDYKHTARTTSAPAGWLLCNGQVVSQATYPALYSVIGDSFATGGEGAGNFRVPNMADRTLIGVSGSKTINQVGGVSTLNLAHSHTINDHTHGISGDGNHQHLHSHNHYMQHSHYMNHSHGMGHNHGGSTSRDAHRVGNGSSDFAHNSTSYTPPSHYHDFSTDNGWRGSTDNTRDYTDGARDWTDDAANGPYGSYTSYAGSHSHGGATGGASNRGTDSQLSSGQTIQNPYLAANLLIKT